MYFPTIFTSLMRLHLGWSKNDTFRQNYWHRVLSKMSKYKRSNF